MCSSKQKRRLAIGRWGMAAGALALVLSGCNLISVATLVGKKFVPAVGKGDRQKLMKHSSRRLTRYWAGFTDAEIKSALSGRTGQKKSRKGARRAKRKKPSVSLVSFKSTKRHAVLVARLGKMKFRFDCVRENGRWKVDELEFPQRSKRVKLSQVLKLLLAAKTLQRGIETGSRYLLVNISTERLRRLTWDRFSDAELSMLTSATGVKKKRRTRKRKGKRSRITTEIEGKRATVKLTGGSLEAAIELVDRDGLYRVNGVKLRLGGQWHALQALAGYLRPTLGLLRWGQQVLQAPQVKGAPSDAQLAELIARLRGTLSGALWNRTFAWLKPADLRLLPWPTIRKAFAGLGAPGVKRARRPKPKSGPSLGLKAVRKLERKGDTLTLQLKLPLGELTVTLRRERGAWRLDVARLKKKGRTLEIGDLLAALAPLAKLATRAGRLGPVILKGNEASKRALGKLLDALREVASRDLNAKLLSRIPKSLLLHIPLQALPRAIQALTPKPGAGGSKPSAGGAAPKLPDVELVRIDQQAARLSLALKIAGNPIRLRMVREAGAWKLDDVVAPLAGKRRSMKLVLGMVAPAAALANGVMTGRAAALNEAFTPQLRKTVVKPLVKILGARFGKLMGSVRKQALGSLTAKPKPAAPAPPPPRPAATAKQKSGFGFRSLTFGKQNRRAVILLELGPKRPLKLTLARDAQHVWRIADVEFPLGGRTLTLKRTGPVLVPLAGFGVSLLTGYLAGIRRACDYSFNRAVWYKMSRSKFRKLLKTFMPKKKRRRSRRRKRAQAKKKRKSDSGLPRLTALRIHDTGRWHWAEVELKLGKRRIRISLVGHKSTWKVHDVQLTVGGALISLKTAAALLL